MGSSTCLTCHSAGPIRHTTHIPRHPAVAGGPPTPDYIVAIRQPGDLPPVPDPATYTPEQIKERAASAGKPGAS